MNERTQSELERVDALAAALRRAGVAQTPADLVVVLGSGLRDFGARLGDANSVDVRDLPEWPVPQVAGHGGSVVRGTVAGVDVVCVTGRAHLYEGWDPQDVVRPLRALIRCGCTRILLTNASGGIRDDLQAGDLMVIEDHINLTARSALVGPAVEELGPRFPDQTAVWDPELADVLRSCGGGALKRGVYAGVLGPSYETPAEIRMLRAVGGDAVGMSTVLEAQAAHAAGAQVLGLSLISNKAAGLGGARLTHEEVVAAGKAAAARMSEVVEEFCARCRGTADDGATPP